MRDRSHWNQANLKPVDPVSFALCSQIELDTQIRIANERLARAKARKGGDPVPSSTLRPAAETTAHAPIVPGPVREVATSEPSLD